MPKRPSFYLGTPITLTIRLSEKQDKLLRKAAKERQTHVSKLVREAIDALLETAAA